jgi:hypothetical protein
MNLTIYKKMNIRMLPLIISLVVASTRTGAQTQELKQLALDIEKLAQFKAILSDLKEGYQILSAGYNSIRDISRGTFSLHKEFLNGLLAVSPAVAGYGKVAGIIAMQLQLVKEYKSAWNRFKSAGFTAGEIASIGKTYTNLLNESLQDLGDLLNVITAGKLRMSDDERLAAIDRIDHRMQGKLIFLRSFNNSTSALAAQRDKEQQEVNVSRKLFDLK